MSEAHLSVGSITAEDGRFTLTCLTSRPSISQHGDVRVFLGERNELMRLPYLLSYYRKLGVKEFFIVDDKSADGSREYLMEQPDCHVFDPSNSFKESRAGVDWQNLLLNAYGTGYWTLVVDADELLVYPHCERVNLPDFCRYLESEGSTSFFAFMLDMYPKDDLSSGVCEPGKPFYEICPYFDKDYKFRAKSTFKSPAQELPRVRVAGGPRVRKFYPFQKRVDFISRLLLEVGIKTGSRLAFWTKDKPHYAPALIKMPLVRWQKGNKRFSNHTILSVANGKASNVTGVLLHFKFFADFHDKAKNEISREMHFDGSKEYRRYLNYVSKNPNFSFYYKGSRLYKGSDSVLAEGLIKTTQEYDGFARKI